MKNSFNILLLVVAFALPCPFEMKAQDVAVLIREAEHLEETRREQDALRKYLDVLKAQPSNMTALCKASELYSIIGSTQSPKSVRIDYYRHAKQLAERALRLRPNDADANFVMSVAMGRMALVLSGHEKIRAIHDIKRYAENAVRLDPSNFKAYHVLGKWHFEVSSLNAFERMGVKLMFGGLPASSFAESIRNYEKSRVLNPAFALTYLECAKAYHKNDQDGKAIELLRKLQSVPVKSSDDPRIKREGQELMKQLLR